MGTIAAWLTGCAPRRDRLDVEAARERLQTAVASSPGYADGQVQLQDSAQTGTVIAGVLSVAGDDAAVVTAQLTGILEAVWTAWSEVADGRAADVRLEAHALADHAVVARAADAVAPSDGATVTTDDLAAHFGS